MEGISRQDRASGDDLGVNSIDTAAWYGTGASELNIGTVMKTRRNEVFLTSIERLRDQGAIRYIGVTGHSSRVLADALEDYPYDTALITLNAAGAVMDDPEDLDRFFRVATAKQVGVIAMKVVGRGALIKPGLDVRRAVGGSPPSPACPYRRLRRRAAHCQVTRSRPGAVRPRCPF